MRRLQFALIALITTAVGATVCAAPSLADGMPRKSTKKKVTTRRTRKACPPRRRPTPVVRTAPPPKIIYRDKIVYRDRVVKAEISQATLDKLKKDIIDSIKIPEPKDPDLTPMLAKLDAQEKMIQMLLECCEQYKKDRTFDLRKTAHFEEQLCDILTLVKQQQECLDKLCKTMAPTGTATTTRTTVTQPLEMKPARITVARDIDGDIFDGNEFRVQLGYDLGKFPLFGGTNSALQLYADHFEVGQPTSGAGLSGRFYTNKTGRLYAYGGAGLGVYTTNFTQSGPHQTEAGGKVFVGLETNRRSFIEFNVTSIQNYGANSRKANVYFGQRF